MSTRRNVVNRVRGNARIMKDLKSIKNNPNINFAMKKEDCMDAFYVLLRLSGDRYKGQTHILELKTIYGAPNNSYKYPLAPPNIKFLTKIHHTNISREGSICLDILKEDKAWSPQNTFESVMKSIEILMEVPNNQSPFNSEASHDWIVCEKQYKDFIQGKKLSMAELDNIRNQCFESFDVKSNQIANSNNLEPYAKYFPELINIIQQNLAKKMNKIKI